MEVIMKLFGPDSLVLERDREIHLRDTSTFTEQVGYVDTKAQVERILGAGMRLDEYRRRILSDPNYRKSYEYPDGDVPEGVRPDPTMDVGFDPSDADQLLLDFKKKQAAIEKARQKEASEAALAAEKADDIEPSAKQSNVEST